MIRKQFSPLTYYMFDAKSEETGSWKKGKPRYLSLLNILPCIPLLPLIWVWRVVTAGWVGSFSPATLSTSSLGDRTVFPCQMRLKKIRHPFRKFWVCSGVFSQVVVLKKPQREELRRHRNQIPGPPQLAPSMQRNSGSSLSSLRMSELLALSKAEPSEPTKEAH